MPSDADENIVVLVMDWRDGDVRLIESSLERAGLHVVNCSSGREALDFFKTYRPSIRLAIVDPATSGVDLPKFLASTGPDIRILFVASEEFYDRLPERANVWGKLRKPFRRAQLLGSVLKAVDEELAQAV